MKDPREIPQDVKAIMDQAASALSDPAWCSVLPMQRPYLWSYVLAPSGRIVRRLRGRKMRTWASLMDEFGAALQFGDYFGENGMALNECLCDLDWLPTEVGYVLVIVDPEQVLIDETDDIEDRGSVLQPLVNIFKNADAIYAEPIDDGNPWDRPAVGFDVILAPTPENADQVRHVWHTAGAPLEA